ncbi:MAG TPA: molybdopterin molybdotransferase MoeA, partial [Gemmatimonadaceae bacterium]|nr:molybdopterin molybdotransferase MoeA [Gemmatimonadaceae bacterium]
MNATPGGKPPLSVGDATALILEGACPREPESVPLARALGRVLAAGVRATRDLPPWRNASMDGYAVRAADLDGVAAGRPARLRVVEAIAAGRLPTRTIAPGEAARIMTGAPLPDGADTVVRVEDTDRGRDIVEIRDARDAGMNVRAQAEDLAAGDAAAAAGDVVHAGTLGVLAAVGAGEVLVHRRPRVAILSTGDELLPLAEHDRAVAERKVVDVNAHTLAALATANGCDVVSLGLAADAPADIHARIEAAAPCDVLLTSGGVS